LGRSRRGWGRFKFGGRGSSEDLDGGGRRNGERSAWGRRLEGEIFGLR
jgi:hypothetical protein